MQLNQMADPVSKRDAEEFSVVVLDITRPVTYLSEPKPVTVEAPPHRVPQQRRGVASGTEQASPLFGFSRSK